MRPNLISVSYFCIILFFISIIYYYIIVLEGILELDLSSSPTFYNVMANTRHLPKDLLQRLNGTFYGGVDNYIRYSTARLGLKQLTKCRPMRSDFGPVIHDVTSFRFPINIQSCSEDLQVFIVTISAPGHFDKRQVIRHTWGRHLDVRKIRSGFLVGKTINETIQKKIDKESLLYDDIIQVDFIDAYESLSLKTVAYLSWINTFCSKVPFIVKSDDDVYLNVHNLATILHTLPPTRPAIYGGYNPIELVKRNTTAKWRISFEVWPWVNYPPYLYGGCYLISGAAIAPLLAAAQVTPYFLFEDVYLIGVCARKADVLVMSHDRIFLPDTQCSFDPFCALDHATWLADYPEEMVTSNRNVEKFYHIKKKHPVAAHLNYSFQIGAQERTHYRLLF